MQGGGGDLIENLLGKMGGLDKLGKEVDKSLIGNAIQGDIMCADPKAALEKVLKVIQESCTMPQVRVLSRIANPAL